mmetsp:Transcript_48951/g.151123  ORF Transcript_48951/g.151123 Transcript_48951/m.151123 type:complete len:204 (-) Transcript_48951:51-662(-)
MPGGPSEPSCRTLSAAARSKLARSSRSSSSPRRPFQTTCERRRGKTSPRRRQTPMSWPRKCSIRRPGAPAETSSAGFSRKASLCSPASASWLGVGNKTSSWGDISSSAIVSRKSRYTPPESWPGSSRYRTRNGGAWLRKALLGQRAACRAACAKTMASPAASRRPASRHCSAEDLSRCRASSLLVAVRSTASRRQPSRSSGRR